MIEDLGTVALYGSYAVMYILITLSILSIGLIVERIVWFSRRKIDTNSLGGDLIARLDAGDQEGARALVASGRSVESKVISETLTWYDGGPAALSQALQASVRDHRQELHSGLVFLGTLGNNAPFVGLFGTVLGVITAFQQLGVDATGSMGNVMSGIGEALVATALGILVALPAVAAHNAFQKRALDIEENIARLGHLIMAQLERARERNAKENTPWQGPSTP